MTDIISFTAASRLQTKGQPAIVQAILLLSMSKLDGDDGAGRADLQTPRQCLTVMKKIAGEFPGAALNFTALYTDGIYLNADEPAVERNRKLTERLIRHWTRLHIALQSEKPRYDIEKLVWNQLFLEGAGLNWESDFAKLQNLYRKNAAFAQAVHEDRLPSKKNEPPCETDILFILNELLMFEKLRRLDVQTPDIKRNKPSVTLFVYPGPPLRSDRFLFHHNRRAAYGRPQNIDPALGYQNLWADVSDPDNIVMTNFFSVRSPPGVVGQRPRGAKLLTEAALA